MVDTPKLGKRVKKETVSEEDQGRDYCRRDGIYSRRDAERIETIGEGEGPDEEVSTSHKTLQGGRESSRDW